MKKGKTVTTNKEVLSELKTLLFAGEGNLDTEGLLTFVKRTHTGDVPQRKIARVSELIDQL